jgi:hypothetical protein
MLTGLPLQSAPANTRDNAGRRQIYRSEYPVAENANAFWTHYSLIVNLDRKLESVCERLARNRWFGRLRTRKATGICRNSMRRLSTAGNCGAPVGTLLTGSGGEHFDDNKSVLVVFFNPGGLVAVPSVFNLQGVNTKARRQLVKSRG